MKVRHGGDRGPESDRITEAWLTRRKSTEVRNRARRSRDRQPKPAAPPLRRRSPPPAAAAAAGARARVRRWRRARRPRRFRISPARRPTPRRLAVPRARAAAPAAAAKAATRDPDDTSPLLTRRAWMGLAWGAFSAASAAALAATGRFMFPNVLNEPPQQFKAGFPNEYGMGVDERWKEKFGIWLVRTPDDIVAHASGFYAHHHHLHASGLHAELSVGGEQVQVPVPRQRLPADRASTSKVRRRVRSSARASCSPTTARSSSTRAGSSSTSSDSGPIQRRF